MPGEIQMGIAVGVTVSTAGAEIIGAIAPQASHKSGYSACF